MTTKCTFCDAYFSHVQTHCPQCGAYEGLSVIDEAGKKNPIKSNEEFKKIKDRIAKQKLQAKKNKLRFISSKE